MRALLTHPTTLKVLIGLYVACITSLLATYFVVSNMDVQVSMYLQASETFVAGEPTAARGIVLDAPTGRLLVGAETELQIAGEPLGSGETKEHGHVHLKLSPPASLTGKQQVHIDVRHGSIEDFSVNAPVTVTAGSDFVFPEEGTTRQTDEKKARTEEWEGELRVTRLPINGEVPRGLPSVVYLLLHDAQTGAPVEGTIMVEKIEGMIDGDAPGEVRTDSLGLARIPLTAVTSQKWTVSATAPAVAKDDGEPGKERTGSGALWLYTVASQFSMVPKQFVAMPGSPVQAFVHTLHRSGGVMVDLYEGGNWAYADAFGITPQGAGVRALVPPDTDSPLVRIQIYQDLFEAGSAWDSRWFAVTRESGPAGCHDALTNVLKLHAARTGDIAGWASAVLEQGLIGSSYQRGCEKWLEAALSAVPPRFDPAPLLINTQQGDRKELAVWRKEVQRQLVLATGAVLFVGFLFILLLVLRGMKRAQLHAELLREVELEMATDDELALPPKRDLDTWLVALSTIIMVITIFTFGASLLMLLRLM